MQPLNHPIANYFTLDAGCGFRYPPIMDMETDIPIPPPWTRGGKTRYQFAEMRVGHSFTRPKRDQDTVRVAAAQYKARNSGWNYTTRIEGKLIRLWCTSTPTEKENADAV
jgi:hypothetical protein